MLSSPVLAASNFMRRHWNYVRRELMRSDEVDVSFSKQSFLLWLIDLCIFLATCQIFVILLWQDFSTAFFTLINDFLMVVELYVEIEIYLFFFTLVRKFRLIDILFRNTDLNQSFTNHCSPSPASVPLGHIICHVCWMINL